MSLSRTVLGAVRSQSRVVGSRPVSFQTQRLYSAASSGYEHIITSTPKDGVAQTLNALSTPLFTELNDALRTFDDNQDVGAIVLTGSEKAFAAGADIKEMRDLTFSAAYKNDFILSWSSTTTTLKKPLISAVNGYALGGGCELAMMADIIYCSSSARFGQPEITLGIIPGAGGSQRLTRAIGKSRAMEIILTGKTFTGEEAAAWGLASKCFPTAQECVDGALATASKIASYSRVAVKAGKEVVNKSQELSLRDGVEFERRIFHGLFGSKDQKIGMTAFMEKDKNPKWEHD